jgi:hypothetical protein
MLSVHPRQEMNNLSNLYRGHSSRNRPNRQSTTNVVFLRRPPVADPVRAFKALTHRLVMEQHRAGTLNPAVVEALLVGVGLDP